MGCGCLFALFAAFTPRLALLFLWIVTPLVSSAFDTFIVPLLGFLFLPFTTLIFVIVYNPTVGLVGWDWLWVGLALMIDLGSYAGSAYTNQDKIPGATQTTTSTKSKSTKKEE